MAATNTGSKDQGAIGGPNVPEDQLLAWYSELRPVKLDIVGDFAGTGLVAIHGEPLLTLCLANAGVDLTTGFQLLHAVHAVEGFLQGLKDRGCNFHVIWLDDSQDLHAPQQEEQLDQYLLARDVVLQHLHLHACSAGARSSFRFPSTASPEFQDYVGGNAVRLVLCRSARQLDGVENLQQAVYQFGSLGFSVAYLDRLEFISSKALAPVASAPWGRVSAPVSMAAPSTQASENPKSPTVVQLLDKWDALTRWDDGELLSAREVVSLASLGEILSRDDSLSARESAAAFLVHVVILGGLALSERPLGAFQGDGPQNEEEGLTFVKKFAQDARQIVQEWDGYDSETRLEWNLYDLVDGRLYLYIASTKGRIRLARRHVDRVQQLASRLKQLANADLGNLVEKYAVLGDVILASSTTSSRTAPTATSVLPFSHPVLDPYLKSIELQASDALEPAESKIFEELTHWNSTRHLLNPKRPALKPKGFFAHQRHQKLMDDIISYSASLTSFTGKSIDPEIIVVKGAAKVEGPKKGGQDWKIALREKNAAKTTNKKKAKGTKSGTEKAQEAAAALNKDKVQKKSNTVTTFWDSRREEFEGKKDKVERYLQAAKYARSLSDQDVAGVVGAEAALYLCNTLVLLLKEGDTNTDDGGIAALLWDTIRSVYKRPLPGNVLKRAEALRTAFGIPEHQEITKNRKLNTVIGGNPLSFQLEHCGPYLDRSFDSAPDRRVRFQPDAWQRKVLDAIDANKSLFVVAPTSAGKTFISFYAIKKVLEANDDDVIVYVAPTKALVVQIAAEIQAGFSKSYHQDGRSVWAIHTRDYRVNNPVGCQVLVTVPHILQIMLLSPAGRQGRTPWSHRVKRIIFDEVHCIGQFEDGIIWEQLLLLAPRPLIALSATVGNQVELKSWLEKTQASKGFQLETVVHSARYSDLRKFVYRPQGERKEFLGLEPVRRLPVPGLDEDANGKQRFLFVHPIAAIVDRNRDSLDDVSLEPRDCLTLWCSMKKHQTKGYPVDPSLEPSVFLPPLIKKADVLKWEAALKAALFKWLRDPQSPFQAVCDELRGPLAGLGSSRSSDEEMIATSLPLFADLQRCGALPALMFNYDRDGCERIASAVLDELVSAETEWKRTSPEWKTTEAGFLAWQKQQEKISAREAKAASKGKKRKEANDDGEASKLDAARESASRETSKWESFDPDEPVERFSFADHTRISKAELEVMMKKLSAISIKKHLVEGLHRGIGLHHAGMNRQYRQVVETLFRRGYLSVVVATGTLALGINMPCKTVIFSGDSVFLNGLNYRQASGRSGRRGFDLLGNVVFHGFDPNHAFELVSSGLPDLRGQFPISTTLVLRLFSLLHGDDQSDYSRKAVESLLSQARLYLGGPAGSMAVKHHVRFSIEYLRRQHLLSAQGVPLNFAGLIGHLYFTENAVFAFHSLLKAGYFHRVCADLASNRDGILTHLMLILCNIFCRVPCVVRKDKSWLDRVRYSPSIVLLPPVPEEARRILEEHNQDVLDVFATYVRTYVDQHLADQPDRDLPFTGLRTGAEASDAELVESLAAAAAGDTATATAAPPKIRSPFAALSGFADSFSSIHELCSTARSGVFLEEAAVPCIAIDAPGGAPWNAYAYDFFRHGDMGALVRANEIRAGEVWFRLKDVSLVMATITTSLANFLDPNAEVDGVTMADVGARDEGGNEVEEEGDEEDDEEDDEEEGAYRGAAGLRMVYKAFKALQDEFDEKFHKVWA